MSKKWQRMTAILLGMLLLLSTAGCGGGGSTATSTAQTKKMPYTITDSVALSGVYTDGVGNECSYSYYLPQISGVSSSYVQMVNQDMTALYESTVVPELESMDYGYSLVCYDVMYQYQTEDDLLSLLVFADNNWGQSFYYAYNMDYNGKEVANKELLRRHGLTEKEFTDLAYGILYDFTSYDIQQSGMYSPEQEDAQLRTLAADNCNAQMPLYLDPTTGTLWFVAQVYSAVGADSYFYVFDTGY